jgi:hypothetical protein
LTPVCPACLSDLHRERKRRERRYDKRRAIVSLGIAFIVLGAMLFVLRSM